MKRYLLFWVKAREGGDFIGLFIRKGEEVRRDFFDQIFDSIFDETQVEESGFNFFDELVA